MKLLYTTFFISALLGVASCGNPTEEHIADNKPAVAVSVATVNTKHNSPFLSASGTVDAVNSATLSTRIMGFVDGIHVHVGEAVTKGQLLVNINNSELSAKQAQANAAIMEAQVASNNAQKDYQRFQNLFNENSASHKELDDMRAHYQMAEARLEAAQQIKNEIESQFAYTHLRAPFDGIVTNRYIEIGDMANPGRPLVAVERPGNFEITVSVPEKEISKIKSGTKVGATLKSIDVEIMGIVTEVSASATNTGGRYIVKVALEESEVEIFSGMYATVKFPVERVLEPTLMLIPTEALVHREELTGIYTVSHNNTAILRWLRLGRTHGNQVEVLSGLSAEETYIVSADSKLYNGAKLTIK